MTLCLVASNNKACKCDGKRYRIDYDNLQEKKKLHILSAVEYLIERETNLTLLEEIEAIEKIEKKKKEDLLYSDFMKGLRLKMIL
jgi:hypothetical protein